MKAPECYVSPHRHKWVNSNEVSGFVRQRCDKCGCYRERPSHSGRWSYVLPDGTRIDPVDRRYISELIKGL